MAATSGKYKYGVCMLLRKGGRVLELTDVITPLFQSTEGASKWRTRLAQIHNLEEADFKFVRIAVNDRESILLRQAPWGRT